MDENKIKEDGRENEPEDAREAVDQEEVGTAESGDASPEAEVGQETEDGEVSEEGAEASAEAESGQEPEDGEVVEGKARKKISLPAVRDYAATWLRKIVPAEVNEAELPAWVNWTKDKFFPADVITQEDDRAFMDTSGVIKRGHLILGAFAVGAFLWAAIVPLDSAIIAHGEVVVKTHRKTVQHLEGGIVRTIRVTDGQTVKNGQELIVLDDTQAKANLGVLQGAADALTAQEARLIAERDGKDRVEYPPELLARASDPNVAEALRGEDNAFAARKAALEQQVNVLSQRTGENARIISGLRNQLAAVREQQALIQQEVTSVQSLYQQGLATLPRLLALQRQAADLEGQRGQTSERIAQAQLTSGENAIQIARVRQEQMSQIVQELRDVQTKKYEAVDRLHAAADTLKHTVIRSPVSGTIVSLTVHTIGAVIKPGETVMEVVPSNDRLEIEAQIRPEDADEIYPGQEARINFSAYKQRSLPLIMGRVEHLSADRLVDPRSGQPYFGLDVTVDGNLLKDYPDARLTPGMPVEVEIATGSRTTLGYLTSPITRAMRHGMREK